MSTSVTSDHEEKETILVDVTLPGHDERVTTSLFSRTRDQLMVREGGRSFVTGKTEQEAGGSHEAHHFLIERCLATAVDWQEFVKYVGKMKAVFDRANEFCQANPNLSDPMDFCDNMLVNGMLIEKELHTGKGTGIHAMPFPLWQFWLYGKEGFKFCGTETVYHEDEATVSVTVEGTGAVTVTNDDPSKTVEVTATTSGSAV